MESETRVDDVLDYEHMTTSDLLIEILEDPYNAGCLGRRPVGGNGHEVELRRNLDMAGEVGHEHECTTENPHHQQHVAFVVPGDLVAHLA